LFLKAKFATLKIEAIIIDAYI